MGEPAYPEDEPIAQVDRAIVALTASPNDADSSANEQGLDIFAAAIKAAAGEDRSGAAFRDLFAADATPRLQSVAASALLRLMAGAPDVFDRRTQARITSLFDHGFVALYKFLNITPKQQSYEKQSTLIDALNQAELAASAAVARITETAAGADADVLRREQSNVFKALRDPLGRSILAPFLPPELIGQRLQDVFQVTQDFLEATPETFVASFEAARATLDAFATDAHHFGTAYSDAILVRLADALKAAIENGYQASELTSPAQLSVSPFDRKYPLSEDGLRITLLLDVHNSGSGLAHGVRLAIDATDGVSVEEVEHYVGRIPPGQQRVAVPASSLGVDRAVITGRVNWFHMADEPASEDFLVEFARQPSNVDWASLADADPYALQPVSESVGLAGRKDILRELWRHLQVPAMGDSFVTGQKRVGKTSIAKTLKTQIEQEHGAFFRVFYSESGDFVRHDAGATVSALGKRMLKFIRECDPRLRGLPEADFDTGLSALAEPLDEAHDLAGDLRFVFMIDEFDELSPELYHRGGVGDPFFQTLRSLSGRGYVAFILIGGEKVAVIMSAQPQALNRFRRYTVDSFDRRHQWDDFRALVEQPVEGILEFTGDALDEIYSASAGNPYFAKLLCSEIVDEACDRRDAVIGLPEVRSAEDRTLRRVDQTNFAHFWEDGILEASTLRREEISLERRMVLRALGAVARRGDPTTREVVRETARRYGQPDQVTDGHVDAFVQRGIIDDADGVLRVKVGLFATWLRDYSPRDLVMSVSDPEAWDSEQNAREDARVLPEEIVDLVAGWPNYQGQPLGTDHVRRWIEQFGDVFRQRVAMTTLQGLRFYGSAQVRALFRQVHAEVRADLDDRDISHNEIEASICVSHFDPSVKSGATMARTYVMANNLTTYGAVDRHTLVAHLRERPGIRCLVLVDDLVASGETVVRGLSALREEIADLREPPPRIVLACVAATATGVARVLGSRSARDLGVAIVPGETLGPEDSVLDQRSSLFTEEADRKFAETVLLEAGQNLDRQRPLGWGGLGLAVVFEWNCPNNSLPVLWKHAKGWTPLFRRN